MAAATEITPRFLYAEYGHTLTIHPADGENADALFQRVCADFENTKIEQDPEGNIQIMAPAGGESGYQNSQLAAQLVRWAEADGRGKAFDSSVGFILPDGSKLSPDGSWVSLEKLRTLTYDQRRDFLRIVPEFVVEIKSPTDRWQKLQAKMKVYMRNGVELGWLIHPDKQQVVVYTQNGEAIVLDGPDSLTEKNGSLAGFALNLKTIWQGLNF